MMKNIKYLLMTTILLGNVTVAPIVSATEEVPNNKIVKKTDEKLEKATSGSVVDRYQAMSELDSNTNQETVTSSTETSTENSTTPSTPQSSDRNEEASTSEELTKKETTTETKNKTEENFTDKAKEETSTKSGNMNEEVVNNQKATSLNWTTKDYGSYVLLTRYNGSDTNLVVPNEVNGKPTKLKAINSTVIPNLYKLTSFTVEKNEKGQKVGLEATSLSRAFYTINTLTTVNLSGLDTSKVTSIASMFKQCSRLTSLDLSNFNTSSVIDMDSMFYGCSGLKSLDLSSFDTSKVTDMSYMFVSCNRLTSLDLSNFVTSSVTEMQCMFWHCSGLKSLDLSSFDTSKVTNMSYMFNNCNSLKSLDLSNFDTSKVTNMSYMFFACICLESLDLSSFDTSKVTNMSYMFHWFPDNGTVILAKDSKILSYDFKNYDVTPLVTPVLNANGGKFNDQTDTKRYFTKIVYTPEEFEKINKITAFEQFKKENITTAEGKAFQDWKLTEGNDSGAQNVYPDLYGVEYQAQYFDWTTEDKGSYVLLTRYNGSDTDLVVPNEVNGKPTKLKAINDEVIPNIKQLTSFTVEKNEKGQKVGLETTSLANAFSNVSSLTTINLSGLDTSNVTTMQSMFYFCSSLTSLNLSNFVTSKVTNMANMFFYCRNLKSLDVSNFDTSKVWSMSSMFSSCSSLTSLDLSNFDTSNVTNMRSMFSLCNGLTNLDLSNFDLSYVEYMSEMFATTRQKPLLVKANDYKLLDYKYFMDNRYPGGPKFEANGGNFSTDSKEKTKYYFEECAVSPDSPKFDLATFNAFKNDLKPTKEGNLFSGWEVTSGSEPENNQQLLSLVTYTAQWGTGVNIPSQDVDNKKPQELSSYGIAYMPSNFICGPKELKDSGSQTINFNKKDSFHIGVRDLRNTVSGWQLSAQLEWIGKELPGAEILTTNQNGTIKKNINNGINGFDEVKDLVECPSSEAIGEANVVIRSDSSKPIMIGEKVEHNSVYDYDLGTVSLRIPETKYIEADTYKGVVNWNLSNTP